MNHPFDSDLHVDNIDFAANRTSIEVTSLPATIQTKEPISDAVSLIQKQPVYISLNADLKSFKVKDEKFSNFIQRKDSPYTVCNALKKIFSCAGNDLTIQDVPFELDEDTLEKHARQNKILKASGLSPAIIKGDINKAAYRDAATKGLLDKYKSNQPMRVFFVDKGSSNSSRKIEIIIIDLYHLLATKRTKDYDEM